MEGAVESVKLDSGKILTFDPLMHRYAIDAVPVPGITSLLRRHRLDECFRNIPEEAKEKGSRIHDAVQYDLENELDEDTVEPEEMRYVEAERAFRAECEFTVISAEMLVGSDLYWYATKIDAYGILAGKTVLINWKSGPDADPYPVQSHLEALLFEHMVGKRAERIIGVHLAATGKYAIRDHTRNLAAMRLAKRIANAQGESMIWRMIHAK